MRRLSRLALPWRPGSPIPLWLLAALLILAAVNLVQLVSAGPGPDHAVDFRPLYLGAGILLDGANPYDDLLMKETWIAIAREEGFVGLSLPGLPGTPLVYPPWALPLILPMVALPWLTAVPVWYGVIGLLAAAMVGVLASLSGVTPRRVPLVDLAVLALAFRAIDWGLLVGQPMFLCIALGLSSWAMAKRDRPAAAGVALGLAAFKPHLALPSALLALAVALTWGLRRSLADGASGAASTH